MPEPPSHPSAIHGPATILIVDDEYATVEALALVLTAEGDRVATAFDGEEALEFLAKERPALVITDFVMPKVNGAHLVARMAADRRWSRIRSSERTGFRTNAATGGLSRRAYPAVIMMTGIATIRTILGS